MRKVLIINGVGSRIDEEHILIKFLKEKEYLIKAVNTLDETVNINKIEIDEEPDLLVGFSLGGLVVKRMAIKYPKSKLILVATANRVAPDNIWFKLTFALVQFDWGLDLASIILKINVAWIIKIYKFCCPTDKLDEETDKGYEKAMMENINYFRGITKHKWRELINFMNTTDTSDVCKEIKNKTLILSGAKDGIMLLRYGEEMSRLITNSQMEITSGGHYDVISNSSLKVIEKFI